MQWEGQKCVCVCVCECVYECVQCVHKGGRCRVGTVSL